MSKLKYVKPKNKAKVIKGSVDIDQCIKDFYDSLSDSEKQSLKLVPSFIEFVCRLVEERYSKKTAENKKIDKKQEVLKHIATFLKQTLSEADISAITNIIEDLHSSGRIKKVSFLFQRVLKIGAKLFLSLL